MTEFPIELPAESLVLEPNTQELSKNAPRLRETLYEQMHLRPYPRATIPTLVGHLLCLKTGNSRPLFELATQLCCTHHIDTPTAHDLFFQRHCADYKLRYEQHSEFETLSIFLPLDEQRPIFTSDPFAILPRHALTRLDDILLIKLIIELKSEPFMASNKQAQVVKAFESTSPHQAFKPMMNGAQVMAGRAELFTHFRLDPTGFSRYLLTNCVDEANEQKGLSNASAGRLLTRLIEFENYRILALLGVRLARQIAQDLLGIEQQLSDIAKSTLEASDFAQREVLMQRLLELAQQTETYRSQISHRASTSTAYFKQVESMLNELKEANLPGFQRLSTFTHRRLIPAVSTCQSVNHQLNDLSERIDRIADLLRTEINLAMEQQNANVLSELKKRTDTQIKMQKTVEGISIVAISYYCLSLLSYGLGALLIESSKKVVLAWAVLPVLLGIFFVQKWVIKRLDRD